MLQLSTVNPSALPDLHRILQDEFDEGTAPMLSHETLFQPVLRPFRLRGRIEFQHTSHQELRQRSVGTPIRFAAVM
jgi:hypothetical protein